MARGRKKKQQDDLGPKRLPSADEVRQAVEEVGRQKSYASDYAGEAGRLTKNFVERYGINRKALSFIISLNKLDDMKRQSCLRDAFLLADRMGFLDQSDAFDDLGSKVRETIDDAAIGNDSERAARTEAELAEDIPAIDGTVSERLREQKEWDTAGEVEEAKKAAARKSTRQAGAADRSLTDEIDAAVRPN